MYVPSLSVLQGKTAEILGLCLHRPPPPTWKAEGKAATMVISPEHLAMQWVSEIHKFCPQMKVVLLDMKSESQAYNALRIKDVLAADIFVITLPSYVTLFKLSENYLPIFYRIVIDECHDAGKFPCYSSSQSFSTYNIVYYDVVIVYSCFTVVSLGSEITRTLADAPCDHVWCVTGTPFPHQDASVYGINQILHIKVIC